jgi:hypothetical protein
VPWLHIAGALAIAGFGLLSPVFGELVGILGELAIVGTTLVSVVVVVLHGTPRRALGIAARAAIVLCGCLSTHGSERADQARMRYRARLLGETMTRSRASHGQWPTTLEELGANADPGPLGPFGRAPIWYEPPRVGSAVILNWPWYMLTVCRYRVDDHATWCTD